MFNPEEVLNKLDLKPDMVAADFGCGSGGFTFPLSKTLSNGLVYALDIQEEPLSALKGRALSENVSNIKFLRCNLEKINGSKISDSSIDVVIIANVLFQTEDEKTMIAEASRVLKEKGQLLIIDWKAGISQGPVNKRVSFKDIKEYADENKLELKEEFDSGEFYNGLIFIKV